MKQLDPSESTRAVRILYANIPNVQRHLIRSVRAFLAEQRVVPGSKSARLFALRAGERLKRYTKVFLCNRTVVITQNEVSPELD